MPSVNLTRCEYLALYAFSKDKNHDFPDPKILNRLIAKGLVSLETGETIITDDGFYYMWRYRDRLEKKAGLRWIPV